MTVENNNNRLSGNSLSFFYLCLDYLKNHSLYAIISSFVIVLSYGFYATKYTFNLDQLVPEYYDGNVLISAGRWAAPLIHFFYKLDGILAFLAYCSNDAIALDIRSLLDHSVQESLI